MRRSDLSAWILPFVLVTIGVVGGCSRRDGPPSIRIGAPCETCGMSVEERRFACVRRAEDRDHRYDSIECLILDERFASEPFASGSLFLADYDDGALRPADSVWVVKGDFPSPMGGGLAAFASLEGARDVMARTRGQVGRLDEIARVVRARPPLALGGTR